MAPGLIVSEERIPPVRGLILLENRRGRAFDLLDLKRWARLSRLTFGAEKVDLFLRGAGAKHVGELVQQARAFHMAPSLRTTCADAPLDLGALKDAGLADVFLCPSSLDAPELNAWLEAASQAGLPVRIQLQAPIDQWGNPADLAQRLSAAGTVSVNLAAYDPLESGASCRDAAASQAALSAMTALCEALQKRDIECNLLHVPFCRVPEAFFPNVANSRQFFLDHQQYIRNAFELAELLNRRGPTLAGKIILILLIRHTLFHTPFDDKLLPWLTMHPMVNLRMAMARRLTRHLRILPGVPKAVPSEEIREYTREEAEQESAAYQSKQARQLGPICGQCSLARICDRAPAVFQKAMPGLTLTAQSGETVVSPLHFARLQGKYYDPVDTARRQRPEWEGALAEEARALLRNRPPDTALAPTGYGVENGYYDAMEAGIRWFSVSNVEKRSTALGRVSPPFTLAALFAAGVADYIGFAFGRNGRIMCPMEHHRHELVLHVDKDGRYVLLRDGQLVRPARFETAHYAPLRLADVSEPRLAVWNIDNNLVTQHVRFWDGQRDLDREAPVKYSLLIVCTRFSRRLQAALSGLVHQQDFDVRKLEVLIGYVPGIDATDDVLQTFQAAHPELRIVRVPFNEEHKNKKGFLINESAKLARGEWIALMDADILVPPTLFAAVEAHSADSVFIAPDGRKMLDAETTAKILLGELHPWECWQELLKTAGEYRVREARGVPIGYFQCVKAECMHAIPHLELDHFETADMEFGIAMLKKYGKETRLSGHTVIHLDHGGSQWYGTATHR